MRRAPLTPEHDWSASREEREETRRLCKWDAAESMRVGEYIKVGYIDAEKACRIVELKILLYIKNRVE